MIYSPNVFCGRKVICIRPIVKKHVARRRKARNKIRSKRLWIDKIYKSLLATDERYQIENTIYAGEQAYAELMMKEFEENDKRQMQNLRG